MELSYKGVIWLKNDPPGQPQNKLGGGGKGLVRDYGNEKNKIKGIIPVNKPVSSLEQQKYPSSSTVAVATASPHSKSSQLTIPRCCKNKKKRKKNVEGRPKEKRICIFPEWLKGWKVQSQIWQDFGRDENEKIKWKQPSFTIHPNMLSDHRMISNSNFTSPSKFLPNISHQLQFPTSVSTSRM